MSNTSRLSMTMNIIVPDGPVSFNLDERTVRPRSTRVIKRARAFWDQAKISKLGQYSTERVERLDQYRENSSWFRVMLVCALMPWPAWILEVLIELIPLQDPTKGWKANYGTWIRLWVGMVSASAGGLFQVRAATVGISKWKIALISIVSACTATGMGILVSSKWVFPLPFCVSMVGILGSPVLLALLFAAMKHPRSNIVHFNDAMIQKSLKKQASLLNVQILIAIVYVAYSAVFARCSSTARLCMLLFLPVMKLALKHFISRVASDDTETIPIVVVFSVDVFNGLYSSICIQSSGTWWTAAAMILLNITYSSFAMREIYSSAKLFSELSQKNTVQDRASSILNSLGAPVQANGEIDIFNAAKSLESVKILAPKSNALIARILFQLEYRVLVGYIEAITPLLYIVHLAIIVHLPSAQYYPHTRSITPEQLRTTIASILLYASTEVLTLMWLHVVVRRKFGYSLFYQLAFVLESETELLQGRLFVWVVHLLQLTLVHFGMDVSFQFKWISTKILE